MPWLGLISYLLINYWSSKTKNGIKAVVYNQVGDVSFLIILAMSYAFIPFVNYYAFLPYSVLIIVNVSLMFDNFNFKFMIVLYLMLFFSKSAQLPLSSWLFNAMSAPTPVSSLLHSSTMVIAGVYLGIIMQPLIMIVIDNFKWIIIILISVSLYTLMW